MAEIHHYVFPQLYVCVKASYDKAKKMLEDLFRDSKKVRFDRQKNGIIMYIRTAQGEHVFVVLRKKGNIRLLEWLERFC